MDNQTELRQWLDSDACGRELRAKLGDADDVWVVGGAVRDLLLGVAPREIDLVTTADPRDVGALLGELDEYHERFGTLRARGDACTFDVAATRTETYATPGALPDVALGATLQEDLERRDFTINAIAMTLGGGLVEYPGARDDLDSGLLRILHERSFIDDPTRLWRLVRYATRLHFSIDSRTGDLAARAVSAGALETVSGDRIGAELRLALTEPDPLSTLHAAQNLGLTPALKLDPALVAVALAILPEGGRRDLVVLASALPDDSWVSTLGFTAAELSILRKSLGVTTPTGPPSMVAAALRDLPNEAIALAGARGDRGATEKWLLQWRDVRLEIDGDDLIAAGIAPGPEIGRRLARTLDAKLDGELSGRAAELAAALS